MQAIFEAAAENWFWTVVGVIAVIGIVTGSIKSIFKTAQTENTRREIAAYIAEGSMTPEQGERLLKAKAPSEEEC